MITAMCTFSSSMIKALNASRERSHRAEMAKLYAEYEQFLQQRQQMALYASAPSRKSIIPECPCT